MRELLAKTQIRPFLMLHFLVFLAALAYTPRASSFAIDPFPSPNFRGENEFSDHVSSAVHEMQTEAALRAIGTPFARPKPGECATKQLGPKTATHRRDASGVIQGVRWPDDPNQLLPESSWKWLSWMHDGHMIAKYGVNFLGKQKKSPWPDYFMNYRGHFGDMQQIHAMANVDGEAATVVRDRIVAWINFLYGVATCDIPPSASLSKSSVASQFPRKGWTVYKLLNPSTTKRVRPDRISEIATGALLHVVQDSFSKAHVKRATDSSVSCPSGRVIRFNSYVNQSVLKHGAADTEEAWLSEGEETSQTAVVQVSSRVLAFIRSRENWDTVVLPYLNNEVFCLDYDALASDSGGYD